MKLPHWMPSPDFIAQAAHFGWGCLIVVAFSLFRGMVYGFFGVLAYAAVKEFVFDKYIEQQKFGDNLKDFAFWVAGACTGVALIIIRFVVLF